MAKDISTFKNKEVDLQGSQSKNRTDFYLTEENLKIVDNLKYNQMKALEPRSDSGWFGWIQS